MTDIRPVDIRTTVDPDGITRLSWDPAPGAVAYEIYDVRPPVVRVVVTRRALLGCWVRRILRALRRR